MCELLTEDGACRLLFWLEPEELKALRGALRMVTRARTSPHHLTVERLSSRLERAGDPVIKCFHCRIQDRYSGSDLCDNCRYWYERHGELPGPRSEPPKPDRARKLTAEQARLIRQAKGLKTGPQLAAEFGCSVDMVRAIWSGRSWTHV